MDAVIESRIAAPRLKTLGETAYVQTLEAMRAYTAQRDEASADELWLTAHPPVYTLGLGANAAHGPREDRGIPVLRVERGGQVTYHGPGQVVLYTLIDLQRRGLKVREFVGLLERAVIMLLAEHGVPATCREGAPGVYSGEAKVAALGLRVSRGRTFHGLALNVDMDLSPFAAIDPCGYPGLAVTQTSWLGITASPAALGARLARLVTEALGRA